MSRDRIRWRLGAGAIALATLLAGATTSSANATADRGPVVITSGGALAGTAAAGVNEFLGIPYAAPPVGQLRWQPPQPAAHWSGVRAATAFGPHCAQPVSSFGKGSTSENCLFLNVFAPSGHRANRPVMFWIHGGALVTGESDDYPPAGLVADGTVVVTINYRLGALGFLAHPALTAHAGGPSGDYGLMDQQAALRWVQRNIHAFGGNPHDVTIFGESAGGLSVLSQLASPGAHGLFAKAIVESGSYNPTQASLTTAEADGQAFATKAGCDDQTAACLRGLPVTTILADQNNSGYTPDVDGLVLTQTEKSSFTGGHFNRVPIIDGTNHDEWRLFVAADELAGSPTTAANYLAKISSTLGVPASLAAVIAAQYPLSAYPSAPIALGAVGTDAIFACNALTLDQSVSRFVPTFAYEFNDENAPSLLPPVSFPMGAAHASEILYVFNTAVTAPLLSASQVQLADTMQRYWTGFAAHGVPSPFWPHFTAGSGRIQSLVPPTPGVETDFATEHHCAFWNALG